MSPAKASALVRAWYTGFLPKWWGGGSVATVVGVDISGRGGGSCWQDDAGSVDYQHGETLTAVMEVNTFDGRHTGRRNR